VTHAGVQKIIVIAESLDLWWV